MSLEDKDVIYAAMIALTKQNTVKVSDGGVIIGKFDGLDTSAPGVICNLQPIIGTYSQGGS